MRNDFEEPWNSSVQTEVPIEGRTFLPTEYNWYLCLPAIEFLLPIRIDRGQIAVGKFQEDTGVGHLYSTAANPQLADKFEFWPHFPPSLDKGQNVAPAGEPILTEILTTGIALSFKGMETSTAG